jgi:hypothetical protein
VPEHRERQDHRDGDPAGDHHGGAEIAEQEHDHQHHEDRPETDRASHAREGFFDEIRLVVGDREGDVVGDGQGLERGVYPARDADRVRPDLLDEADVHHLASVVASDAATERARLDDGGHVGETHGHGVLELAMLGLAVVGDRRPPEGIDAVGGAVQLDGPLELTVRDDPGRSQRGRAVRRGDDPIEADAPRVHATGIDAHRELPQLAPQGIETAHPRHGGEAVAEVDLDEVAEGQEVAWTQFVVGVPLHDELHHLVEARRHARDQRGLDAFGKEASRDRHPLADQLSRAKVVCVGIELDRGLDDARLAHGADATKARQARQRALERHGHPALDLFGAHGGGLHDHREHGRGQIGEDVAGKGAEAAHPIDDSEQQDGDRHERPRRRASDQAREQAFVSARTFGGAHSSPHSLTSAMERRRKLPWVTTSSPPESPSRISISPSSSRPRTTGLSS